MYWLILGIILWGKYSYYQHFIDEETGIAKG